MPYVRSDNRTARTRFVDLIAPSQDLTMDAGGYAAAVSSGAVTGALTKAGLELGDIAVLRLVLVVTAASGTTPSLTPIIETSYDNGVTDAWRACPGINAFGAQTATGTVRGATYFPDRWVRYRNAAPTGTTPSFTFTVAGEGFGGY